jgi:SAM-dependent methyltransferase
MDFSHFDKRRYQTLPVQEGYGEWVANYEQTVQDEMDIRLFARLQTVAWAQANRVLDLACGTGRIGVWLRQQGVQTIDGMDFTPEMLARAAEKGVYNQLFKGSVFDTGLPSESYDLAVQSLADEHLPTLPPLYREVARIVQPGGRFILVGLHPQYLMNGIPTHFHRTTTDEPIAVESYVHLLSDHIKAAHAAGWTLVEMDEGVVDQEWLAKKPQWEPMLNQPVSFAMVWQKHG